MSFWPQWLFVLRRVPVLDREKGNTWRHFGVPTLGPQAQKWSNSQMSSRYTTRYSLAHAGIVSGLCHKP